MKVKLTDIRRTNLGFPSEWKGKSVEGIELVLSYRYGRLKIFEDGKQTLETCKDDFDVGGYLSDEDLTSLLKKHDLLSE